MARHNPERERALAEAREREREKDMAYYVCFVRPGSKEGDTQARRYVKQVRRFYDPRTKDGEMEQIIEAFEKAEGVERWQDAAEDVQVLKIWEG